MSLIRLFEAWAEGIVRILIGVGLLWIGAAAGSGYGVLLEIAGAIIIAAGIVEIWLVETAARRVPPRRAVKDARPALAIECELPVFYATSEGQTRRIAETLAATLRERGFESRAFDLASADPERIDWSRVRGVLLGASLHLQHHQRAAERFVREHAAELNRRPSAFFSVSMSVASEHLAERDAAKRIATEFPPTCGWHPDVVVCFAGRLAYSQYGLFTRFIMKRIARKEGGPTDTSRDYEFTNWNEVAILAERVVAMVNGAAARSVA